MLNGLATGRNNYALWLEFIAYWEWCDVLPEDPEYVSPFAMQGSLFK
jgi:hypothetical protein